MNNNNNIDLFHIIIKMNNNKNNKYLSNILVKSKY